jgi:hypothetical protein
MPKTSLKRFASHLNLMVDENFGKPVADGVNKHIGSIKAKTIFDFGFRQGTKDRILIAQTNRLGQVLLTFDQNSIDERRYPPCTHGGIIIVKDKHWTTESVVSDLKAFTYSGSRKLTAHCVTHLFKDRAVIHQHDGKVDEVKF